MSLPPIAYLDLICIPKKARECVFAQNKARGWENFYFKVLIPWIQSVMDVINLLTEDLLYQNSEPNITAKS